MTEYPFPVDYYACHDADNLTVNRYPSAAHRSNLRKIVISMQYARCGGPRESL